MQLEFHSLRVKRENIMKAVAPARKEYNDLRAQGWSGVAPGLDKFRDTLNAANDQMFNIDRVMSGLTRAVEALHVLRQGGVNFRPGVATMGQPAEA